MGGEGEHASANYAVPILGGRADGTALADWGHLPKIAYHAISNFAAMVFIYLLLVQTPPGFGPRRADLSVSPRSHQSVQTPGRSHRFPWLQQKSQEEALVHGPILLFGTLNPSAPNNKTYDRLFLGELRHHQPFATDAVRCCPRRRQRVTVFSAPVQVFDRYQYGRGSVLP